MSLHWPQAPMGIRVNAILPGVIKTPMVSDELMAAVRRTAGPWKGASTLVSTVF